MIEWLFKARSYPHFDHFIKNKNEAKKIISNFQKTGQHSFLPFIEKTSVNRKFKRYLDKLKKYQEGKELEADEMPTNKDRPIKYAAHADAQIYSYYRVILANHYEATLENEKLSAYPIAYRQIPLNDNPTKGKCNIHYAKEAFDEIVLRKNCAVLTVDVKGFFESLNHTFLEQKWCEVLNVSILPTDHKAVFNSVTNYSFVSHDECYKALGFIEVNERGHGKFTTCPFKIFEQHKMLCSKADYREKIINTGLVKKNQNINKGIPQGIPQGSPISDILANIYMLDFDRMMANVVRENNAYYRRYSDDILWICDIDDLEKIEKVCNATLKKQGNGELLFGDDKTTKTIFEYNAEKGLFFKGDKFSYLGFSFDGKKALYRESTISRYNRNIAHSIQSFIKVAKKRADKDKSRDLGKYINYGMIFNKIYYPNKNSDKKEMTFMTYHERSKNIFNIDESRQYSLCDSQLKNIKKNIHKKIVEEALKGKNEYLI